jgi:hypothetical protein
MILTEPGRIFEDIVIKTSKIIQGKAGNICTVENTRLFQIY